MSCQYPVQEASLGLGWILSNCVPLSIVWLLYHLTPLFGCYNNIPIHHFVAITIFYHLFGCYNIAPLFGCSPCLVAIAMFYPSCPLVAITVLPLFCFGCYNNVPSCVGGHHFVSQAVTLGLSRPYSLPETCGRPLYILVYTL